MTTHGRLTYCFVFLALGFIPAYFLTDPVYKHFLSPISSVFFSFLLAVLLFLSPISSVFFCFLLAALLSFTFLTDPVYKKFKTFQESLYQFLAVSVILFSSH
ncbi:hypothetical protein ACJX0J_040130, partial [Zea mays]